MLLLIAAAAVGIAPVKPDLSGRRIVAYDDGTIDWSTTDPGNVAPGLVPRYGLLPALVASLGGDFVISKDLSRADLQDANVLIVLPPGGATCAGNHEQIREKNLELRQCGRRSDRSRPNPRRARARAITP